MRLYVGVISTEQLLGAINRQLLNHIDMLTAAVESLALLLDRAYLKTGSATPEVLASYGADHGFEPHA